jgi:hypothetical protein
VTKYLIFATCLVFGCGRLNAQQTAWSHRRDTRKCRFGRERFPMRNLSPGRNRARIQNHLWHWRMRKEQ